MIEKLKLIPIVATTILNAPLINKANTINNELFSFNIERITQRLQNYLEFSPTNTNYPSEILNISFTEKDNIINFYTITPENYTETNSVLVGGSNPISEFTLDIEFSQIQDITEIAVYKNETKLVTNTKDNTISINFNTNSDFPLDVIQKISIITEEEEYKSYDDYNINQSRLQTLRLQQSNFTTYQDNNRFNFTAINKNNIDFQINFTHTAEIEYTNKTIKLPILGTFRTNNIQYNLIDFYFTDTNNNVINLLNYITNYNTYFVSNTREVNQSTYTYQNASFNFLGYSNNATYKLEYQIENNEIQITTNDVGISSMGNATITNKEENITSIFITSLFGINPLTNSYFGSNETTKINQLKTGGSVTAMIYQIVNFTNYTPYMQLLTYNDSLTQQHNAFSIPLSNFPSSYTLNLITFRQDTNDDIQISINDITTLFGTLDILENLGTLPFTLGTIITIGFILGFIMVLVKILK